VAISETEARLIGLPARKLTTIRGPSRFDRTLWDFSRFYLL
jgi:hypothetical protein